MTRGTFVIIVSPTEIRYSTEFNGDMYMEGKWSNGKKAYNHLKKLKSVEDFEGMVRRFNDELFHYDDNTFEHVLKGDEDYIKDLLKFNEDYIAKWFSDFLYLKNMSEQTVYITTEDLEGGDPVVTPLDPGNIAVINFGALYR